jgi:hypothetical protein
MEGHGFCNRSSRVQAAGLSPAITLIQRGQDRDAPGAATADRHRRLWLV